MLSVHMRNLATRVFLPMAWSRGRQHAAQTLKTFSNVEFDSAWQYLNAMQHVQAPEVQLMLFQNLLEEMEHSDAFLRVAQDLAEQRLRTAPEARVALVNSAADIPYFLAFAHESERAICAQFNGYARACERYEEAAAVFKAIAIDEAKHEREARESLIALIGDERTARSLVLKVKLRKTYAAWMRGSMRIGDLMFALWFGVVYAVFGPLLGRYCARRMAPANPPAVAPALLLRARTQEK